MTMGAKGWIIVAALLALFLAYRKVRREEEIADAHVAKVSAANSMIGFGATIVEAL